MSEAASSDPVELLWFALIGILGGLVGLLYAKSFYGIADRFARLPLPRWLGPTIGGVSVGLMGLAIPQVLGTGYGWVQLSLSVGLLTLPLWVVLVLPFAKILATGQLHRVRRVRGHLRAGHGRRGVSRRRRVAGVRAHRAVHGPQPRSATSSSG